MNTEERIGKVERKVNTIEKAVQILTELIVSHDERLVKSLNNDEDLNAKISALVDAQIRSEDKLQALAEAQVRGEDKLQALAEAQVRSEDKLQALAEVQVRSEDKLQNINLALEQLTQLVGKAHSRIDRLEN